MEASMSPHTHITIVALLLLTLCTVFIMWTLYKMKRMTAHIHFIEDFVKFYAELAIAQNNPQKMVDVYNDYQSKISGDA